MGEVVFRCLPRRQLWVRNLSKVAMQWLDVASNLRLSGCKAQNIPIQHPRPSYTTRVSPTPPASHLL